MSEEKVVLILGAGATLADALCRPKKRHPPLDRGFFSHVLQAHGTELSPVSQYMRDNYGASLVDPGRDSLERVMAILYTDVFGGDLQQEAYTAFLALIRVFIRRLALTTNDMNISKACMLYRIVVGFLNQGTPPDNICLISFNQDIQAEKTLYSIHRTKRRAKDAVFSFPNCYCLPKRPNLTKPTDTNSPTFEVGDANRQGMCLLKLHGSLNWYSIHNSATPGRRSLFNPSRVIGITRRQEIDPSMMLDTKGRAKFTFPIVVPPVVHKSGILHNDLKPIWSLAGERLRAADRVVIFGYSCPANDWESANLLSRALRG